MAKPKAGDIEVKTFATHHVISQPNPLRKVLRLADARNKNIRFHRWPTDRVWTRDSGCTFVCSASAPARGNVRATMIPGRGAGVQAPQSERGTLQAIKWRFNAWAKYSDWKNDDLLPDHVDELLGLDEFVPALVKNKKIHRVVLEGGSVDVNGRGSMLTTEECLLSKKQQRNPGLSRKDLENYEGKPVHMQMNGASFYRALARMRGFGGR